MRSASSVDRIVKGARVADLPVERPSRFDLAVAVRTAKALGLTLPQSLLLRADRIVESRRRRAVHGARVVG